MADDALFAGHPTPSFFHLALESEGFVRVEDIKYLSNKYIIQWVRDSAVEIEPLELDGDSPMGDAEIGIFRTNEDQGGFQRAFAFAWGKPSSWQIPFYASYIS